MDTTKQSTLTDLLNARNYVLRELSPAQLTDEQIVSADELKDYAEVQNFVNETKSKNNGVPAEFNIQKYIREQNEKRYYSSEGKLLLLTKNF